MTAWTQGHGPARVMGLHGWFGTGQSFGDTVQWLDQDVYTFVAPDYRGYGTRMDVPGKYTVEEIASDMFEVAGSLGWDTFDLVGHSMGGKVAQRMLAGQPARVRKVVAVTPVPPVPLPFDEQTFQVFRGAARDPKLRAAIIGGSMGDAHCASVTGRLVAQSLSGSRAEAVAGYLESWAGDDFSAQVAGQAAPILVLVGERDNALTAEVMRQALLPFYPNAQMTVLPSCGHYPIHETPAALATAIDAFLNPATSER